MRFEIDIPELFEGLSGIYRIENDIDDRIYIGRSKNLKNRAKEHRERLSRGGGNSKFKKFIKEHPDVCFRLTVEMFTTNIKEEEERLIEKYHAVENGFNMVHNDDEFVMYKWDKPERKKRVAKKKPIKPSEMIKLRKIPEKAKKQRRESTKRGYSDTRKFCAMLAKMREKSKRTPL